MVACNCRELYFLSSEVVDYFFNNNRYSLLFESFIPRLDVNKNTIQRQLNLVTRIPTIYNFDIVVNENSFVNLKLL